MNNEIIGLFLISPLIWTLLFISIAAYTDFDKEFLKVASYGLTIILLALWGLYFLLRGF